MDVTFCLLTNNSTKAKQEKQSNDIKNIQHDKSESTTKHSCIKLKKHPVFTANRVFKSVCIMMINLAMGLSSGLNGPTLVHIEYLLHTNTQGMGFAYMTENIGYILGSISCGVLMQYCNPELILGFMSLWVTLSMAGLPWAPNIVIFGLILMVKNVAYGFLDSGGQSYMLQLWKDHKHKDPVFNALQCTWTSGAFLSSFIVLPFLSELPQQQMFHNHSDLWASSDTVNQTDTFFLDSNNSNKTDVQEFKSVRYAYMIAAMVNFSSFLLFYIAFCLDKSELKNKEKTTEYQLTAQKDFSEENTQDINSGNDSRQSIPQQQQQQPQSQNPRKRLQIVPLTLLASIILFETWMNYNFNTFISAFVIKGLQWDVAKGPLVTSVCRCGELFGQIVGIPISARLHPRTMLLCNISMTTVAFCLMYLAVVTGEAILLWISVGMAGIFMSTIFGCVLLWGSHFVKVTAQYGSLFMIAVAVGIMSSAAMTGYLFDNISQMWVIYIGIISASLLVILFLSIALTERFCMRKNTADEEITH